MGFSNKRGRPKKLKLINGGKPDIDLGTVELQQKRLRNLTAEPIDVCLNKGIIDENQHASALHFRWLYTLKFGAAGVSAMDLTGVDGREIKNFDEDWELEREQEYSAAIERLRAVGALRTVMNTVIFNHRPHFLTKADDNNPAEIRLNKIELTRLREGLTVLSQRKGKHITKSRQKLY